MKMQRIEIAGTPVPQKRPRAFLRGEKICFYDPCAAYKNALKKVFLSRGEFFGESGFFHINLEFHFKPPPSWPKNKRFKAVQGDIPHTSKPDIDNLQKLILDAGNGIFYKDDSMVIKIKAKKMFAKEAKTIIEVANLGEIKKCIRKQKNILKENSEL